MATMKTILTLTTREIKELIEDRYKVKISIIDFPEGECSLDVNVECILQTKKSEDPLLHIFASV